MAHPNTREKDVPRAPPGRISGHTLTMPISHTESDRAIAKMLPPDISLEQQQLDLLGPAYVLDWTDQQRGCVRKRIGDAEELRASIFQGEDARVRERRVFVIQGLPAEYLPVLRDVLDVDVRFLEAHVARRAYTPLIKRSVRRAGAVSDASTKKAGFACFEYPELMTSARRMATTATTTTSGRQTSLDVPRTGAGGDVVGEAPTHVISKDGELVIFCRASVWLGSKADVLLLDRPAWTRPSSEFRKAAYPSSGPVNTSLIPIAEKVKGSSVGSDTLHSEHTYGDRDEIPSLETLLYQSLMEEIDEHVSIDQPTLIEDIAIHQWIEFFEALPADLCLNSAETAALYRQIQNSLERNLSQSEFRDRTPEDSYAKSSTAPAWVSLLSRLSRRISLLSYLNLPPTSTTTTQTVPSSPSPSSSASNPRAQFAATALPPQTSHRSPVASEQNQQSLDRISYMGGVLLPLSIVSSILSMSDPFNPGRSQFFVFWAASIPLVIIAIIIIYADSIRKAEVWIEVASSSGSAAGEEKEEEGGISMPEFDGRIGAPGLARRRMATRMDGAGVGPGTVECESDDGYGLEEWDEPPGMMVEKTFKNAGKKKWRREQLGWMGACKAVFRIYKLKKGRPPNWATNVRRGNTV